MKQAGFDKLMEEISLRFGNIPGDNIEFARELIINKEFPRNRIGIVLRKTNKDNIDFARELVADKEFPRDQIIGVLRYTNTYNVDFARDLYKNYKAREIAPEQISILLEKWDEISYKDL